MKNKDAVANWLFSSIRLQLNVVTNNLNDIIEINFVNSTATTLQINTTVLGFAGEIPEPHEILSFLGAYYYLFTSRGIEINA